MVGHVHFHSGAQASLSVRADHRPPSPHGSFPTTSPTPQSFPPRPAAWRVKVALRRNWLYFKSEKFLTLLSSRNTRKILFSGNPEWMSDIRNGFGRLAHHIDHGAISADSFRRYDIVVPMSLGAIEEARQCSQNQKTALPIPSAESVRLCNDKYELNQALIKAGFCRYIPGMALGQSLTRPYILKKRTGLWGKDCYIIRNHEDENRKCRLISDPTYFCQEVIPGPTEFATHILFIGNRILKALNIEYGFECDLPIKGQDKQILRAVHRCPYLGLFAEILRTIQFQGLCCVNYKVADGRPFLLEINPRFGGSLAPFFFSFIRHIP